MTRSVNINSLETDAKKVTGPERDHLKKSIILTQFLRYFVENGQLITS